MPTSQIMVKRLGALRPTDDAGTEAMQTDVVKEEWRSVVGFPAYAVSNLGRVRRVWRGSGTHPGKITHQMPDVDGYPTVVMSMNAKRTTKKVPTLVALAFLGPKPTPKHEVAHDDGTRTNSRADNLRWATRSSNHADKLRHGTHSRGSRNPVHRLNENDVLDVLSKHVAGRTLKSIARDYGVCSGTIQSITTGRNWGWLTGIQRNA